MSDLRTGARGKGNPLHYSDIGFQSSNKVGVSDSGNKGASYNGPVGAKEGQNPKGAVPNVTGQTGGRNIVDKYPNGNGGRTGGGHDAHFPSRTNS